MVISAALTFKGLRYTFCLFSNKIKYIAFPKLYFLFLKDKKVLSTKYKLQKFVFEKVFSLLRDELIFYDENLPFKCA